MVLALGKLREQYYVKLWVFCGNDMSPLQNHYWLMIIRDYNSQYLGFSTLSFPDVQRMVLNCVISTVPMKNNSKLLELHRRSHMYLLLFHGRNIDEHCMRSFNLSVVSHGRDFSRKRNDQGRSLPPAHRGGWLWVS